MNMNNYFRDASNISGYCLTNQEKVDHWRKVSPSAHQPHTVLDPKIDTSTE